MKDLNLNITDKKTKAFDILNIVNDNAKTLSNVWLSLDVFNYTNIKGFGIAQSFRYCKGFKELQKYAQVNIDGECFEIKIESNIKIKDVVYIGNIKGKEKIELTINHNKYEWIDNIEFEETKKSYIKKEKEKQKVINELSQMADNVNEIITPDNPHRPRDEKQKDNIMNHNDVKLNYSFDGKRKKTIIKVTKIIDGGYSVNIEKEYDFEYDLRGMFKE